MITDKVLRDEYLDWANNYLTVDKFAEHREIPVELAREIINTGRIAHENYIMQLKECAK